MSCPGSTTAAQSLNFKNKIKIAIRSFSRLVPLLCFSHIVKTTHRLAVWINFIYRVSMSPKAVFSRLLKEIEEIK